jgi:hypothetical protein
MRINVTPSQPTASHDIEAIDIESQSSGDWASSGIRRSARIQGRTRFQHTLEAARIVQAKRVGAFPSARLSNGYE